MDHQIIARQYFAEWLDISPSCLNDTGVFTVCTQKRDRKLKGYGRAFPLYCFIKPHLIILSFSPTIENQIQPLAQALRDALFIEDLKRAIAQIFTHSPSHAHKYCFTQLPESIDTSRAVQLTRAHYPDFLAFHQEQYPNAKQEEWLEDYAMSLVDRGYIFAIYENEQIVSAVTVPDVPYMADQIAEPGIATLAPFRRRGYARTVTTALLKRLIASGKTPIWSCSATNIASSRLAESLGFQLLGDVVSISF